MVSIYPHIFDTKNGTDIELMEILLGIKSGRWEDDCYPIMKEEDKVKRNELKKKVPYYTVSGTFEVRSNNGLRKHSGFISIDFDNVENLEACIEIIKKDPYTFAVFKSVSHTGFCVIVKIDPARHLESFEGLGNYYFNILRHPIDQACKDVSRPRYVSFDPDCYINSKSKQFRDYPKRETKEAKHQRTRVDYLHTANKFSRIIASIDKDITGDYAQWRDIGFAIGSEYKESGEDYFHQLSQFSPKYDRATTSRQYKLCCKTGEITISTFYYYAKLYGFKVTTDEEKKTAEIAYYAKISNKKKEFVTQKLKEIGIKPDDQIIEAVNKSNTYTPIDTSPKAKLDLDAVITWITTNTSIKKNEISRFYEQEGKVLETEDFNSMFIQAKKTFEKLNREIFDTIIFSDNTQSYNPIKLYIDNLVWDEHDRIIELCQSITSNTGDFDYRKVLLQSWLLGIIESIYTDEPNILQLILAGKQNTGKSVFFKNLLPAPLKKYFAFSQLDKGKDDELLMCQKLIILDDEYSGKSKQDAKLIKRLLSAPLFDLREPYGKKNITLKRMASLCATSNETQLLNDPTGNRRNIIFEVTGQFDYEKYNSIDKEQLFAQIKWMFDKGYKSALMPRMIEEINMYTGQHNSEICIEAELVNMFYEEPGIHGQYDFRTATQIKNHIESNSVQKISIRKLGMELKRLGYERVKVEGVYGYYIGEVSR